MGAAKHLNFIEKLKSRLKPEEPTAKSAEVLDADFSDCDACDEELPKALERKVDKSFGPINKDDG